MSGKAHYAERRNEEILETCIFFRSPWLGTSIVWDPVSLAKAYGMTEPHSRNKELCHILWKGQQNHIANNQGRSPEYLLFCGYYANLSHNLLVSPPSSNMLNKNRFPFVSNEEAEVEESLGSSSPSNTFSGFSWDFKLGLYPFLTLLLQTDFLSPSPQFFKHTDTEPVISHLTFEKLPPPKFPYTGGGKGGTLGKSPVSLMEGNLMQCQSSL